MRDESTRAVLRGTAAEQYRLALTYHEMGMPEDAVEALEAAARSPRQRFDSASMLGRLYLDRKDAVHAIEWLDAPPKRPRRPLRRAEPFFTISRDDAGIDGRAFARPRGLCRLESESGGYRDVNKPDRTASKVASPRLGSVQAAPVRCPAAQIGLLLVLIPWSAFWDRTISSSVRSPGRDLLTSNYTRGAITGLGLVNVWAALAELADLFSSRRSGDQPSSPFDDPQ